jgi:hypothetical protein
MFNFISKKTVLILLNKKSLILNKVRPIFNKILFYFFKPFNSNLYSISESKYTTQLCVYLYKYTFFNKNVSYSYLLNSIIFDRRYIYSALFLIKNKYSNRRKKRFLFQHFSYLYFSQILLIFKKKYNVTTKFKTLHLLAMADYFNTIWYLFFKSDWLSARLKRLKLPSRGQNKWQKWLFNLNYIKNKKPISYLTKKLKKNKKKPIILKNHFNVGFGYGYIWENYATLLTKRGVL